MKKIRVLIVDDSVFMRQALTKLVTCDAIEVIDIARNGKEAVDKVIEHNPDVVTMDIEMPIMNGIDALREIMAINPVPVIMVSTLTSEGANATIEALSIGAVDFITKKSAYREMDSLKDELVNKIIGVGSNIILKNQLIRLRLRNKLSGKSKETFVDNNDFSKRDAIIANNNINFKSKSEGYEIIGIGISTGGPNSLNELIRSMPDNFEVPIVIAQHMPPFFTKSLADRLNTFTQLYVKEAEDNEKISKGVVYIAPGGKNMRIAGNFRIRITEEDEHCLFKPSVNILFESLATIYKNKALGIIMTGMGHDGLDGIKSIVKYGGYTIAQDPETCVISGMPKTIIDAGLAKEIQPLNNIVSSLIRLCGN